MKHWLGAVIILVSTNVWAEEEDSFTNYDSIVNELKAQSEEVPVPVTTPSLHPAIGVGVATNLINMSAPNGAVGEGFLTGFVIHGGFDLSGRNLRLEGAFRFFANEDLGSNFNATLKEFEARTVFQPNPNLKNIWRFGIGLSSRMLDIQTGNGSYSESTPSSILSVGMDHRFSKNLTAGPELSYRSALIRDTSDKSSWDAALRINAYF